MVLYGLLREGTRHSGRVYCLWLGLGWVDPKPDHILPLTRHGAIGELNEGTANQKEELQGKEG